MVTPLFLVISHTFLIGVFLWSTACQDLVSSIVAYMRSQCLGQGLIISTCFFSRKYIIYIYRVIGTIICIIAITYNTGRTTLG